MLKTDEVAALAQELMDANGAGLPYRRLSDGITPAPSLDDAYRVQRRYQALLRDERGAGSVAGYKIALTSKAMQAFVNVDQPLSGCVFSSRVHRGPAVLRLGDYQHVGVEFEVAVRLAAPLGPLPNGVHTRDSVAQAVGACAAAFELVEDRNADYAQIDAFSLVAENAWNAGVVLGTDNEAWRQVDLEKARTQLWVDGEAVGEGVAGDALGHPLEALAWLANHVAAHGEVLPVGSFVMTGSSITTRFPVAGQHYRFEVEGLGIVETRFEA